MPPNVVEAPVAICPPKIVEVPVGIIDYPLQPRSYTPPGYIEALSANIKANGQQVPGIGWRKTEHWQLVEGGCRLEAIKLAGLPTMLLMDLVREPTRIELLLAQASMDIHRQHLPPVDRARLYQGIMTERNWNGKQTCESLGISPSLLSRTLLLLDLAEDLQGMVNRDQLDWTKASLIAQATKDHDEQRRIAKETAGMKRDALAGAVRQMRNGHADKPAVLLRSLKLPLSSGVCVTVKSQGEGLTLDELIENLSQLVKEAKKASERGLDSRTFMAMCRDLAKA